MSIEALIKLHTEALVANTEAVKLLTLSLAGRTPKVEDKPAKVEKFDKSGPTGKNPDKVIVDEIATKDVTEVAMTALAEKVKEDVLNAVPYETVRALVLKLAPTQRDAIKSLNSIHGIANLKVLLDKEDDFSTVNDQAKLEAVYADLKALEAVSSVGA